MEAEAVEQDIMSNMVNELRMLALSLRHPYHHLPAWVVEAASVLAWPKMPQRAKAKEARG